MNQSKNPLAIIAYLIIGLLVLIFAFSIVGGILRILSWLASVILGFVFFVLIVYAVYLFIRWASKNV